MAVRRIIKTETGPVLVHEPEGVKLTVIGGMDDIVFTGGDHDWAKLHKQLKTGKLDFDTVRADITKSDPK